MEGNSMDDSDVDSLDSFDCSSDEYSVDNFGNKKKMVYGTEEEKKLAKQRKMINRMQLNVGWFFKEN